MATMLKNRLIMGPDDLIQGKRRDALSLIEPMNEERMLITLLEGLLKSDDKNKWEFVGEGKTS